MNKKDSLGDRMKFYERQYAGQKLLPLIPVCARLDGKAFHSFTRGLPRPFDIRLSALMVDSTKYLVRETGATVGYTQSDEISLIWYAESLDTQIFFDASLLKMTSVLASMLSVYFNHNLAEYIPERADRMAFFDARVWNVPTLDEAGKYLLWREQDATRNSLSMAAQSVYSHKALMHKSSAEKHEMLFQKGINWNDYPDHFRRGTYVRKMSVERPYTPQEMEALPLMHRVRTDTDLKIWRSEVRVLDLPPIRKIANRVEVLFNGAEPTSHSEEAPGGEVA